VASDRQLRQLRAALAYDEADVRALTEAFLEVKVAVYADTLGDLADEYGYELDGGEVDLADDLLVALRDEARRDAQSVVDTFNEDMGRLLDENAELPRDQLIDLYETWAEQRADSRSEMIAVSEAYPAHADATIAFWRAAGVEPEFDFGVHEADDAPPQCEVCIALAETSPHPLARVLAVGTPHINCRQSWAEVGVDADTLPDTIQLGEATAGVVGGQPLVDRLGNHAKAAAYIRDQAG
jgi:hypothetical protein